MSDFQVNEEIGKEKFPTNYKRRPSQNSIKGCGKISQDIYAYKLVLALTLSALALFEDHSQ